MEVSYTILEIDNDDPEEMLQEFATVINVQLMMADGQKFPFIPFIDFDSALKASKLFLYGTSGCGKSKAIFEIIKQRIRNLNKIYVINPRQVPGRESGRINLLDLISAVNPEKDAIVWDNFPDDLIKRDIESSIHVLELISARDLRNLFVVLKPRYLEIYREIPEKLHEFYSNEISYDKEKFKQIIQAYGTQITQFGTLYRDVSKDLDKISTTLWQKEPIPITVLDYYKELRGKEGDGFNPVLEAEKFSRVADYYEHQFKFLTNSMDRRNAAEFLYALKLSYEIGLDRDSDSIAKLQRAIFGTAPPTDPLRRLGTWIYLSGQSYAMHDARKDAIKLDGEVMVRIIKYVVDNFGTMSIKDSGQIYLLGIFLGKHVQFVPRDASQPFLPANIYELMKNDRHFAMGFGQGAGSIFLSLDEPLQKGILRRVEVDIEFTRGLCENLGSNFSSFDRENQEKVLGLTTSGLPFARYLGESLGLNFLSLSSELWDKIFKIAKKNVQFADGLGMGIGYIMPLHDDNFRRDAFRKAENNGEFTRGVGYGLGRNFLLVKPEFRATIFEMIEKNREFAAGKRGILACQ